LDKKSHTDYFHSDSRVISFTSEEIEKPGKIMLQYRQQKQHWRQLQEILRWNLLRMESGQIVSKPESPIQTLSG
jgi:hypothetical protein